MRSAFLLALACFCTLAAGEAPGCWADLDPGAFADRCPVVVSGVIARVDPGQRGGRPRVYDTAHIVIRRVLKNELNEPLRPGGFVRVRMNSDRDSVVASTDIRYPVGTAGTWLIALKDDGELYINVHPVQRQAQAREAEAAAWSRQKVQVEVRQGAGAPPGITRAQWHARHKEGKSREPESRNDPGREALARRVREVAAGLSQPARLGWDHLRRFGREPDAVRRQLFNLERTQVPLSAPNHLAFCGHILRHDHSENVRTAVANWLDARDPRQAALLCEALDDRSGSVRVFAVQALRNARDPAHGPRVARLLGDPDPWVRETAVTTLGWLGDRGQVPAVLALFHREGNQKNVYAFACTLARLGETEVSLDCARAAFQSDNWNVRHFAVEALAFNGSKEVVPAIVGLLAGELGRTVGEMKRHNVGDRVFVGLCDELRKRTGQKLVNDVLAWHDWWEAARHEYRGRRQPFDRDESAAFMAEYRRLAR